jgi:hypothetical protein
VVGFYGWQLKDSAFREDFSTPRMNSGEYFSSLTRDSSPRQLATRDTGVAGWSSQALPVLPVAFGGAGAIRLQAKIANVADIPQAGRPDAR